MTDRPEDVMRLAAETCAEHEYSAKNADATWSSVCLAIAEGIMADRASRIRSCLLDKPEASMAKHIEDMRLAASSIREWMPETLPANEDGQIHFARALAESAATAIEKFIGSTPPAAPVRDEAKRIAVLEKAMEALRKTAVLLLQNAQGCAVNHYGGDFEMHGLPGWLCDARTEIEAATAVLSATLEPADDREGLVAAAAKVRADYERANMKPCDCSTPDGALHYGRAQGLEMAADMLSASPSPVDSRDGLIERLVKALEGLHRAGRKQGWHNSGYSEEMEAARLALTEAKEQQP